MVGVAFVPFTVWDERLTRALRSRLSCNSNRGFAGRRKMGEVRDLPYIKMVMAVGAAESFF